MKNLISTKQFETKDIYNLFTIADGLDFKSKPLKDKILASIFYEPSTRTRFSFESAMLRLGGSNISTENAKEFSSVSKGESLEDTVRMISNYADVMVLRHFVQGASEKATRYASIPVINAGDGAGEHPTQALLDLYTIFQEKKTLDQLSVALVGDLKYGRTIHSLFYLLAKFKNVEIFLISPDQLKLPDEIKAVNRNFTEIDSMDSVISDADVVYMTRVQKERFSDAMEYEKLKDKLILTAKLVNRMKKDSIIMHPLPRINEIPTEIDHDPRAVYFKQAEYGLKIRMAILNLLLT